MSTYNYAEYTEEILLIYYLQNITAVLERLLPGGRSLKPQGILPIAFLNEHYFTAAGRGEASANHILQTKGRRRIGNQSNC